MAERISTGVRPHPRMFESRIKARGTEPVQLDGVIAKGVRGWWLEPLVGARKMIRDFRTTAVQGGAGGARLPVT